MFISSSIIKKTNFHPNSPKEHIYIYSHPNIYIYIIYIYIFIYIYDRPFFQPSKFHPKNKPRRRHPRRRKFVGHHRLVESLLPQVLESASYGGRGARGLVVTRPTFQKLSISWEFMWNLWAIYKDWMEIEWKFHRDLQENSWDDQGVVSWWAWKRTD